jgi:hypothetical protein
VLTRRHRTLDLPILFFAFAATLGAVPSTAQAQCAPGEYFSGAVCLDCDPGTFCPDGTNSLNCSSGQYQPSAGQSNCLNCAPGTSQPNQGSITCDDCATGTFSVTSGSAFCADCAAGTFQSSTGQATCADCAEDTFQPDPGADACFACACDDSDVCTTDSCDRVSSACFNDPILECTGPAVPSMTYPGLVFFLFAMTVAAVWALRPRHA